MLNLPFEVARALKGKEEGSEQWCVSLLSYLESSWALLGEREAEFRGMLAVVEERRLWEVVPPNNPYGSLDALLRDTLEVGEPEVRGVLTEKQITRRAAGTTRAEVTKPEDVLPVGRPAEKKVGKAPGEVPVESGPDKLGTVPNLPQGKRAEVNGVTRRTQGRLDKLARERPELLELVEKGELSAKAGMVEAGFEVKTISVPLDPKRAAAALIKHFSPDDLAAICSIVADHIKQ